MFKFNWILFSKFILKNVTKLIHSEHWKKLYDIGPVMPYLLYAELKLFNKYCRISSFHLKLSYLLLQPLFVTQNIYFNFEFEGICLLQPRTKIVASSKRINIYFGPLCRDAIVIRKNNIPERRWNLNRKKHPA